jgi:O-antigen ligase
MTWPSKLIRFCFYLTFIIVPLIFLPTTSELFEFNKMIATYLLTITIVTVWVFRMIAEKKLIFRRTPLDLPILIFLFTQFISLLFSVDARSSLLGYYSRFNGGLASLACYAVMYWAYVTFMDRKSTWRVIAVALVTSALVSFYGVLEHFGIDASLWVQDVKSRVFSTMGQPNWLAAYLVVLLPLAVSLGLTAKTTAKKITYISASLLLLITILFTKSQSGIGVTGVILFLYLVLLFLKKRSFKILLSGAAIFLLLAVLNFRLVAFGFHELSYISHVFTTSDVTALAKADSVGRVGGSPSTLIRRIVWQGAVNIWLSSAKNFWIGTGPETFAMTYYQFRPLAHNYTSEWDLLYNKAHNEFFNYLSTTGILGLGSYLVLLGAMLVILIKAFINSTYRNPKLKNAPLVDNWPVNLAILVGWLSISITNFWGFSVVIVQVFLFLLPALVLTINTDFPADDSKSLNLSGFQIIGLIVILAFSGVMYFSTVKYWAADTQYALGDHDLRVFSLNQNSNYILTAYQSLSQAYDLNPYDPPIISEFAVVTSYVSVLSHDTDSTASAQLAQTALDLSQKAINISPLHPNYYKNLSRVAIILSTIYPNDLDVAFKSLLEAQKVSPTDPRIPYNLGTVAIYEQHPDQAVKYFRQALALKPDYADPKAQLDKLASASAQIKK